MEPQAESGHCAECGFLWSISIEEAIRLVGGASDRYARLLADGGGARSEDPDHWSATGYLWHVVDIIRFGTERLWTLTLEPGAGVPGWDQNVLAEARHYEKLSLVVGLRALSVALQDWVAAAMDAPPSAEVQHPVLGTITTDESIRRNAHEVQHHELDILRTLAAG